MIGKDTCLPPQGQGTFSSDSRERSFRELKEKTSPVKLHAVSSFKVKWAQINEMSKM